MSGYGLEVTGFVRMPGGEAEAATCSPPAGAPHSKA
jgi:hypothetical protein